MHSLLQLTGTPPFYRQSTFLYMKKPKGGRIQAMLIATLRFEQMVSDGHAIMEEKTCLILKGVKEKK